MKQLLMMLSVDLDLPTFSVKVRDQSLFALLDVLDRKGIAGASTWFINDNDFALTRNHQPFLREVVRRGGAVGSHEHLDFLDGRWGEEPIREFMTQSVSSIRAWLGENGFATAMRVHRFGCLFQHPIAYRIAGELGFDIHSDVCPGTIHHDHLGNLALDNSMVPVGAAPYRHGPDNITDFRSTAGPFLQIPVLQATLTASWWPKLGPELIDAWFRAAAEQGRSTVAVSLSYHPFEFVTKNRIDPDSCRRLEWLVDTLRDRFDARFLNMEQYAEGKHE